MRPPPSDALTSRWRGQRHRLEVWYSTFSDPATGLGCWIHHETVSPVDGDPYAHGWAAVSRPDAEPVLECFGPRPARAGAPHGPAPGDRAVAGGGTRAGLRGAVDDTVIDPPHMGGSAGRLRWDLDWDAHPVDGPGGAQQRQPTLYTFPRWAWEREVLPAAQVVPVPSATFRGSLWVDDTIVDLSPQARGNVAHIYGHGSADRWAWLHADLGHGDVLEIVSAVGRRSGLRRLPPLTLVQLRLDGHDWPRDPLLAAPMFRTRLGLPTWNVDGRVGRWRLRVAVTIPEHDSVRVGYVDPDGATALCTNSTRADATISLERRGVGWVPASRWDLHARAHAEIGTRP